MSAIHRAETWGPGIWSVDDITAGKDIDRQLTGRRLVRMAHAAFEGPGGVRYFLADDDCVDLRDVVDESTSPKLSYGVAFSVTPRALHSAVETVDFGHGTYPIPVIGTGNLGECLERRPDVERDLRAELGGILSPSAENGVGPQRPNEPLGGRGAKAPPWSLRIHVVNVGQGDTILIEWPGRRLWVIDAYFWRNARYDAFVEWLANELPGYRIEKLIISHFHYDHIRSVHKIVADFHPAEVLFADPPKTPTKTANNALAAARNHSVLRQLMGSEEIPAGAATVRIMPTTDLPGGPALTLDPNEHGIVVAISTARSRVLLPGDVPGRLLRNVVGHPFMQGNGVSRFYKVTHHCSATGDDDAFLTAYPANHATTSCSAANRYNHPHNPPRTKLDERAHSSIPQGEHRKTFEWGDLVLPPYEIL